MFYCLYKFFDLFYILCVLADGVCTTVIIVVYLIKIIYYIYYMLAILINFFLLFNGTIMFGFLLMLGLLIVLRMHYTIYTGGGVYRTQPELLAKLLYGVMYILFVDAIVVIVYWYMTMDWIDVYWNWFTVIGEAIYFKQYFYLDVPELPFSLFVSDWFILDSFSLFFKVLAFLVLMFVCRFITYSAETYRFYLAPEVPLFLLLVAFGAYGVFHSSHWFLLCVYFEILALSLVVLPYIANRYSNIAVEGALVFLVISFIASIAFFIYGLSFFYVSGGEASLVLQRKGFFQLLGVSGGSLFTYSCGCFFVNCCFFIKLTL